MTDPFPGVVVLRPTASRYFRMLRMRLRFPGVLLLLLVFLARFLAHPEGAWVYLAVGAAILVCAFATAGLFLVRARIKLEDDRIDWTMLARRGSFRRQDVKSIEISPGLGTMGRAEPFLTVLGSEHRRLLRFNASYWPEESIAVLQKYLAPERP
jgi:hypothetical protein